MADGPAGAALLAAERGHDPGPWLAAMLCEPLRAHPDDATLFDGLPAIVFTLTALHRHPTTVRALDHHIDRIVHARLDTAARRAHRHAMAHKAEFDLISGLTGFGALLLDRDPTTPSLSAVLAYLTDLTAPRHDGLPGWWAASGPTGPGPAWRHGHGNLGMAHGISGPLALLAVALLRGIEVPGQRGAMHRVCRWLDRWRHGTRHGAWWPETVTLNQQRARRRSTLSGPPRPSWCYGTPGIARAQQLAALALDDRHRQRDAQHALAWCASDPTQLAQIVDISLCHGWAGLLHTVTRAAEHDDHLTDLGAGLLDQLTTRLPRDSTAGHDESPETSAFQTSASHGLLTGTTGAQLAALAAHRGGTPPATGWDRCLLLGS